MTIFKKLLILGASLFLIGTILLFRFGKIPSSMKVEEVLPLTASNPGIIPEKQERFLVTKVIDGDTIALEDGQTVRYIGIDAPETRGDCFSTESTDRNKELVLGKAVRLEKDVSERDRYQRLLRYVWVDNPSAGSGQAIFINDYLVKEGYAKVSTYPPDVKYQEKFLESEKYARDNNLGLWSKCPDTTSIRSDVVNPTHSQFTGEDKDCGDFKTHAEAQEFFISQGGPGSDPHKLDSDHDGLACESLP